MSTERVYRSRTLECGALLGLLAQLAGSIAVELGMLGGAVGVLVGWGVPAWAACGFGLRLAVRCWSPVETGVVHHRFRIKATALAAATAIVAACSLEPPDDPVVIIVDGPVRDGDGLAE